MDIDYTFYENVTYTSPIKSPPILPVNNKFDVSSKLLVGFSKKFSRKNTSAKNTSAKNTSAKNRKTLRRKSRKNFL